MSFESMTRLVAPQVRKAPFDLVLAELREAAIRFFMRTEAWRQELAPMTFAAGQTEMALSLPEGSALVSIPEGTIDGDDLVIAGYEVSWDAPESLVLSFVPTKESSVVVVAVLKPSYTSLALPEAKELEYGRAVSFGAIAALKAMRGTEWHDPDGATINFELFKGEMAAVKRRRIQGKANRNMYVRPVSFF